MPLTRRILLALLLSAGLNACTERHAQPGCTAACADLVFVNGSIYTVDDARSSAEAVAVRDGAIILVGDSDSVATQVGSETRVIDLDGKLMLPGLHDLHIHPYGVVRPEQCEFGNQAMSLDRVAEFTRSCVERSGAAPGEWVVVRNWNYAHGNQPSQRNPTIRAALDAATSQHPVLIRGNDGHHAGVNSLALAQVGVTVESLVSEFSDYVGLIAKDSSGEPSGGVTGAAIALFGPQDARPPSHDYGIVRRVPGVLAAAGITSILDAKSDAEAVGLYRRLEAENNLTFRYHAALFRDSNIAGSALRDTLEEWLAESIDLRETMRASQFVRVPAVKIFIDGVLEGDPKAMPPTQPNAAVLSPYLMPRFAFDASAGAAVVTGYDVAPNANFGRLIPTPEFVRDFYATFDDAGFTVVAHAIGDRAVRTAVDAIERLRQDPGREWLPHSIAHAQLIHPLDVQRIGQLGVVVAMTHGWSIPDPEYDLSVIPFLVTANDNPIAMYRQDNYYIQNAYPARSITRAGGIVTSGSDAPVDSRDPRPFFHIEKAVTRTNELADLDVALNDKESLRVDEAIASYTIHGARALFQDDITGSIEVGKRADLIVVDQNILELARSGRADEISETRVWMTVFDGKVVYSTR